MARKAKPRSGSGAQPSLSAEQRLALHRKLAPLGEERSSIAAELKLAGFAAFAIYEDYSESFLQSDEERALQARYDTEIAKMKITDTPGVPEDYPLVMELNSKQQGRARGFADPRARQMRKQTSTPAAWEAFEYKRLAVLDEVDTASRSEATQHATGLSKGHHETPAGRPVFFLAAMERHAGPLGFLYDRGMSRSGYPVFAKPLDEDWALCWVINNISETGNMMLFTQKIPGDLRLSLQLRSRRIKGVPKVRQREEWVEIRIKALIPSFELAYEQFQDLDHMEWVVSAHMRLYQLAQAPIEGACLSVLSKGEPEAGA